MILVIQIIVIIVALAVVVATLSQRGTYSGKAWKKIFFVILSILMIVSVIFPDITNYIAGMVGVGRGADLLLYITVLAFIVYTLNNYLGQQDQRDRVFRLARQVALLEAKEKNKQKK